MVSSLHPCVLLQIRDGGAWRSGIMCSQAAVLAWTLWPALMYLSFWRLLCRKTCLLPEEVLQSVYIPFTGAHEYVGEYKQSHKRDDDLAVGNAAFRVLLEPATPGARHYAVGQQEPPAALSVC